MAGKKTPKSIKKINSSKYIDLDPVYEGSDVVVLVVGDFSPPSLAEQQLVNSAEVYARLYEADTMVFVSKRDINEGYLGEAQRIQMSRNVFGDIVYPSSVMDVREAIDICLEDYTKVIVIRMDEDYHDIASIGYNGQIEVIEYKGTASQADMLESVISGDLHAFKQTLATPLRVDAESIFESMLLDEECLSERIRPMTYLERLKRAQTMKRYATRIEMAKERAADRRASPEKLRDRARRRALEVIRARILKNKSYSDLTPIEKSALDARLMYIPQVAIDRIVRKMLPVVRRAETERLNKKRQHVVSLSASSTSHRASVNEKFDMFVSDLDEDTTIQDLFSLIEAVENTALSRAKSSISKEKEADAVKHQRMIIAAKRADLNKYAATKFASLDKKTTRNESSDAIQQIIDKEQERKKLAAALKDYSNTPDIDDLTQDEKQKKADEIIAKSGSKKLTYRDIMNLYKKIASAKSYAKSYNEFDVVESNIPDSDDAGNREQGTDSLVDIYRSMTPGQ